MSNKPLTRFQQKFYDLYLDTYGMVVLWHKEGRTRILNPNEIEIIKRSKDLPKKRGLVERFLGR